MFVVTVRNYENKSIQIDYRPLARAVMTTYRTNLAVFGDGNFQPSYAQE